MGFPTVAIGTIAGDLCSFPSGNCARSDPAAPGRARNSDGTGGGDALRCEGAPAPGDRGGQGLRGAVRDRARHERAVRVSHGPERARGRQVRLVFASSEKLRVACRTSSSVTHRHASSSRRLDAPTDAPAWPRRAGTAPADGLPQPIPLPKLPGVADTAASAAGGAAAFSESDAAVLRGCIAAAAEALLATEAELTEWCVPHSRSSACVLLSTAAHSSSMLRYSFALLRDTRVGDGDCGKTLSAGARAILADLPSYPLVRKGTCLPDILAAFVS